MKRPTAPVAARMTARDLSAARAKRAAEIAERSAAIKRRQVLAGSLASAALILALLAGFGVLSWAWMLIPTAALVAVLEAGRRVAASYREADLKARKTMAALERRMRALNARDARPAPRAGGQSASAAPELESTAQGESATGQAADNPSGATEARAEESTSAPARDSAPVIVASDVPEAVVGEVRWDPVAVPAPSYTLKAPAPRRTIEPHADTLPSEEKAAAVPARPTTARMLNATDDQADDASVIDVDSALARRRVAGE